MKALAIVAVLTGAAHADGVYTLQVAVDTERGTYANETPTSFQGISFDVSAGGWLTDRVSLSAFVRGRDILGQPSGEHPTEEGWLGLRGEVAAAPRLFVGAGFGAVAMGRAYDDRDYHQDDATSYGLYAEAHVSMVIPIGPLAIGPVFELGHIDVGGNTPSGSIYGRLGVGLRW